jgi:hypothetical protein
MEIIGISVKIKDSSENRHKSSKLFDYKLPQGGRVVFGENMKSIDLR